MPKPPYTFVAVIENFDSNLWHFYLMVPDKIAQPLVKGKDRRVICTFNEKETVHCALMPKGGGGFFILVNKKLRDKLKLKEGLEVKVSLEKDSSEYGMPMPEELAELMKLDDEGDALFHALTPGKQRTLMYIVGNTKNIDTRIRKSIVILNHLKASSGKVDYKILANELKSPNN